jgi:hypothetical protein
MEADIERDGRSLQEFLCMSEKRKAPQKRQGFDNQAVLAASCCFEEAWFLCWNASEVKP